jgi:hypothetical protein
MVNGSNEAFNARHRTGFSRLVGRKGYANAALGQAAIVS